MEDIVKKVHIIGICGIGMSAIAKYLKSENYEVQGSDRDRSNIISEQLKDSGILVLEHSGDNILEVDCIIKSTAIKENDEEVLMGLKLNIPVLSRSDILTQITNKGKNVICISGAHGKTTTTTMTAELFYYLNENPTVFSGGIMGLFGSNFRKGTHELMVVEADESDGTFMNIKSDIAVLTNIEFEHAEYYKDLPHLIKCCEKFLNGKSVKSVIVCGDDPVISKLQIDKNFLKYGFDSSNDISASLVDGNLSIVALGREIKNVKFKPLGRHNVLNALAALSIAIAKNGLNENVIEAALKMMANYHGVGKRFDIIENNKGLIIVDDYAHHPTEIRATISSAKQLNCRIIAVLQPHKYTRLKAFLHDFASSIDEADLGVITDVYSAGETPIEGISGEILYEMMKKRLTDNGNIIKLKNVFYGKNKQNIFEILDSIIEKGDLILFMSASKSLLASEYSIQN